MVGKYELWNEYKTDYNRLVGKPQYENLMKERLMMPGMCATCYIKVVGRVQVVVEKGVYHICMACYKLFTGGKVELK